MGFSEDFVWGAATSSYQIEGMEGLCKGSQLMNIGVEFPLHGAFKSRIFKIVKQ